MSTNGEARSGGRSGGAQIHDLGYRPYEGERAGVAWAMTSLGAHAIRRVLGLKRAARHKLLPALTLLIAFVPAIVFVGMASFIPDTVIRENLLPSYGDYYGFTITAIFLFASFVAPEAICTDRRTGMLALYLASPLDRTTYVISKIGAVATVLATITLLPLAFLLIAYTIAGAGPEGLGGFVETLLRIVVAGLLVAVYFAALTSAVSSFTSRRGIASAAVVLALLVPTIVVGAIVESTDAPDEWGLLDLSGLPIRTAQWLLADEPTDPFRGLERVAGATATAVTVAATCLFAAIVWWRYQRLEVER
jgi:ABC-2 type transport system permease protein